MDQEYIDQNEELFQEIHIGSMKTIDKYRGCLIGGAAGDALGYPVEFMDTASISRRYGTAGITAYELDGNNSKISDDTQMTLFTATGLLLWKTRGYIRGIAAAPWEYVHYSYRDWYRTQTEKYPLDGYHYSWLDDIPELFFRRAPGNTCLSVLSSAEAGSVENPINDSKGCGGIMRAAPVGLYFGELDIKKADYIGAQTAALTHGHPLGYIPAAALVHLIALISHSDIPLPEAVLEMRNSISEQFSSFDKGGYIKTFTQLIDSACQLAEDRTVDDQTAIKELGEGWVAEETLAIGVYCALRHKDNFDRALIAAVNHDGDSDSTGSITGNILGAYLGFSAIPEKYTSNLELRDIILEIADDLFCGSQTNIDNIMNNYEWKEKYFHNRYPRTRSKSH